MLKKTAFLVAISIFIITIVWWAHTPGASIWRGFTNPMLLSGALLMVVIVAIASDRSAAWKRTMLKKIALLVGAIAIGILIVVWWLHTPGAWYWQGIVRHVSPIILAGFVLIAAAVSGIVSHFRD